MSRLWGRRCQTQRYPRPFVLLISFRIHTDVAYNLLSGVTCAFNTPYGSRHAEAVGAAVREPWMQQYMCVRPYRR